MVSKKDKKFIAKLVSVKVVIVVVFILLVIPIYLVDPEFTIQCVGEPCEVPQELVNGVELIRRGLD